MDFIQSLRVSNLESQLEYWSNPENVDAHFNNLKHPPAPLEFVTFRMDDGFITYEAGTVKYVDLVTGKIFLLRKFWGEHDYQAYCDLVKEGEETGLFRFNKPVYREVTGNNYEYIELACPNNQFGVAHIGEFVNRSGRNTLEYQKEDVIKAGKIFKKAYEISQRYDVGVPQNLGNYIDRMFDDVGEYWPEVLSWTLDYDSFVDLAYGRLKDLLWLQVHRKFVTPEQMMEILTLASGEWK